MTIPTTLSSLINAFVEGNRFKAMNLVASDFGIHDGLSAEQWVAHEMSEFAKRRSILGFDAVTVEPADHNALPGCVGFSVSTGQGEFLYEDAVRIGKDGKVAGLGRNFEIVSKLHYDRDRGTSRGLALRSPRGAVQHAMLLGLIVDDHQFHPGMAFDEDRFYGANFFIRNDTHKQLACGVYLRDTSGAFGVEPVILRGVDNPRFVADLFPEISGSSVEIPHRGLGFWALSVALADGGHHIIDHPKLDRFQFEQPVIVATLTDALDNDWTTRLPQ